MSQEQMRDYASKMYYNLKTLGFWLLIGTLVGIITGCVGSTFSAAVKWANAFRIANPYIIAGLPFGGLLIVFFYKITGEEDNQGTSLILAAIRSEKTIPPIMALLILVSTFMTHLFGGSAGREGAAIQFGGGTGAFIGKRLHFSESNTKLVIMAGMAGAFSALFGTSLAAVIFSMEVISVGVMYYAALVPCTCASFVAYFISVKLHANHIYITYPVDMKPLFFTVDSLKILILAVLCPLIGVLFCILLHGMERLYRRVFPNQYIRVFAAGCIIFLLASILRTQDYLGQGTWFIEACFREPASWYSFILKALFTALTLGAGFKGGEIVPSLFIGAAFGSIWAPVLYLPVELCTACGMIGVFCAVTNCPLASLFIAFELFGFDAMPYFAVVVAVSYLLSGYYGIFPGQKIMYSKTQTEFLNRKSH